MATTEVSPAETAPSAGDEPGAPTRRPRWWLDDRLLAIVTWLVGLGAAFLIVGVAKADPISVRGATMPIGLGIAVFAVLLAALWLLRVRLATPVLGMIVGAYAAWVALTTKAALYGTPMSFGGMYGDAHRIVAQAAKYATSWGSTDVFQPNTPSDYPPLYTWLTGRAAALLGEPAWQLVQDSQVLWLSATVVAVYLLWRRLLPAPVAAVIALLAFAGDANPVKPYEVITLAVMVPWILATFARPPRGRLHWLPAGLIGGLIFLTYQGFLVFMGLGVLAIIGWTWRAEADRRAYLLHLAKVAGSALVVSSWYLGPYVWATLTRPSGSFGSDTFQSGALASDPLPMHFFETTPAGVLQLIGLVGLVVFFTSTWWARPLAALLASVYVFFALGALRFTLTGHTMFYQYSIGATIAVAAVAGVLTVVEALTHFAAHRHAQPARRAVVLLTVATIAATSLTLWRAWMPTTVINIGYPTVSANAGRPADLAHQEPLPDLTSSKYGPKPPTPGGLPVTLIQAEVVRRLGSDATPMVLSADERLFAYVPWYEYAAARPTASPALDRWAERQAELIKLAAITDPTQFAQRAAHTAFGSIDVFVLQQVAGSDRLQWNPATTFRPEQFNSPAFDRFDLPNNFVVFVGRP